MPASRSMAIDRGETPANVSCIEVPGCRSTTAHRTPRLAKRSAAVSPVRPPLTMRTAVYRLSSDPPLRVHLTREGALASPLSTCPVKARTAPLRARHT